MPHTYAAHFLHVIWATRDRTPCLDGAMMSWMPRVLGAVLRRHGCGLHAIGYSPDHLHMILQMSTSISISKLFSVVKPVVTKRIRERDLRHRRFAWAGGYAAFSVSVSDMARATSYVQKDAQRHKSISYLDELRQLIDRAEISYDEKYFPENGYCKNLVHVVWSTKERRYFLHSSIRQPLFEHLGQAAIELNTTAMAVGGVDDHVHMLLDVGRKESVADVVQGIKVRATSWLKEFSPSIGTTCWQEGYGVFSVGFSNVQVVAKYIAEQEKHHQKQTSQEEWDEFCGVVRAG